MRRVVVVAALWWCVPAAAHAEAPCDDSVIDPVVTPVRDAQLDAQRAACLRSELSAGLRAHALIDTPGFRGVLGGELELGGRRIIGKAHELSAALTLFDYTFVQNAVNKVTHTGYGPIILGAAAGKPIAAHAHAALSLRLEVPFSDDERDTTRTSAQLAGLVSGELSPRVTLHARLAAIGRITSSLGGETYRLAFVAGTDLAFHVRPRIAIHTGTDVMAGWTAGVDHLLVRGGVHWRARGGGWRLRIGGAVPIAGHERTNAILDVAILVDR
jgi:hypothetical protein